MCLPLNHQNDKDVTLSDSIRGPNPNSDFPSHKYSQVTWAAQVTPFSARPTFFKFAITSTELQFLHSWWSSRQPFLGYTNVWTSWSLPSQHQSGQVQGERFSNVNQILFSLSWVSQQSGLVTRVTIKCIGLDFADDKKAEQLQEGKL